MMNPSRSLRSVAGVLALCGAVAAPAATLKTSCDVVADDDSTLSARYSHTAERAIFDVSVKAPARAGFVSGAALGVSVDGRRVATVVLDPRASGALTASVAFDSYGNAGYVDPAVTPFPRNWPGVTPRSIVQVGPLVCQMAP